MAKKALNGPSESPKSSLLLYRRLMAKMGGGMQSVIQNPRLRGEVGWVIFGNATEFVLAFAALKVLTTYLGKEAFGEFSLAQTSVVLLAYVLLYPMNQAYLRYYHTAEKQGLGRSAGKAVLTWYAIATMAVAIGGGIFSYRLSQWFGLEQWTAMAVGLCFMGVYWRMLGIGVLRIRRRRRAYALQSIGFQITRVCLIALVICFWWSSASAALFAHAGAAAIFALIVAVPLVRRILSKPAGPPSKIMKMVATFGLPYGALVICQWLQGFADRYILGILLDFESVGLYVAAYMVCGIPYMFLLGIMDNLLVPVAYQRAKDVGNPKHLWSADKVILGGAAVYLTAGAVMMLGYVFFGQRLLVLLTTSRFVLPVGMIVCLVIVRYVQCLAIMLEKIFAVHQKMGRSLLLRAVGAMLTIPICWFAISAYGITGAAVGMLVANGIYVVVLCVGPGGWVWMVRSNRRLLAQTR